MDDIQYPLPCTGDCCNSCPAELPSTIALVLNLQENLYPTPKEKSTSIKLEADLWSIKPPSMHSHCELKLKLISPARPIFFVLPLNVGDLSFKHPRVLCRYFWTSGSVGLMLSQRQYRIHAKSPSCERLSESYRKSFCSHH